MPCRCDYPDTCNEDPGLRDSANKSTRAACDMRTILRRHNLELELTLETRKWIKKHDDKDAARIAVETRKGLRQRVKQAALDKLSLEERRVLGL